MAEPIRVAIIGGGCAALTCAFELTRPERRGRYQVTVYQQGWRLGGKGASGRGPAGRIEEHGLHVWMGWYENAFAILREAYDALEADPQGWPARHWRDAFVPDPYVGVADRDRRGGWSSLLADMPERPGLPGDPIDRGPFTIASYLRCAVDLLIAGMRDLHVYALTGGRGPGPGDAPSRTLGQQVDALISYGRLATLAGLAEAGDILRRFFTRPSEPPGPLLALLERLNMPEFPDVAAGRAVSGALKTGGTPVLPAGTGYVALWAWSPSDLVFKVAAAGGLCLILLSAVQFMYSVSTEATAERRYLQLVRGIEHEADPELLSRSAAFLRAGGDPDAPRSRQARLILQTVLAREDQRLREQGVQDERVLAAMMAVPRHLFVEEALASRAYEDTALPLGLQQTISQPFVVARMIEILRAGRELGKTLEVGTGCGYQAAVLSHVATEVYSVERLRPLLDRARNNLRHLRLPNVRLKHADGSLGLREAAPYDTIIVAAAAPKVPQALVDQLSEGGRLILPVGAAEQSLVLIERTVRGIRETRLSAVRFVPLLPGIE
mgnify:CR=1 FL=1